MVSNFIDLFCKDDAVREVFFKLANARRMFDIALNELMRGVEKQNNPYLAIVCPKMARGQDFCRLLSVGDRA